jgi:hypothetical protein
VRARNARRGARAAARRICSRHCLVVRPRADAAPAGRA